MPIQHISCLLHKECQAIALDIHREIKVLTTYLPLLVERTSPLMRWRFNSGWTSTSLSLLLETKEVETSSYDT